MILCKPSHWMRKVISLEVEVIIDYGSAFVTY